MKTAAFVISIVGFVLSLIPIIGVFSLFLLVPAFLLAIAGIIVSYVQKKGKNGLGYSAIILCIFAFGIVVFQMLALKATNEGLEEAIEKLEKQEYVKINGEQVQVPIIGLGGFELGSSLDSQKLNKDDYKYGYKKVKIKTPVRKMEYVNLYFTPKTNLVYKISASERGTDSDWNDIKTLLEEKYKAKMGDLNYGEMNLTGNKEYVFSGNGRSILLKHEDSLNTITYIDNKLSKQYKEETTVSEGL